MLPFIRYISTYETKCSKTRERQVVLGGIGEVMLMGLRALPFIDKGQGEIGVFSNHK